MSIKKWNVALYQIDLRLYFYYKTNMYDILFDSEESYSTCISCDTRGINESNIWTIKFEYINIDDKKRIKIEIDYFQQILLNIRI